MKKNEEFRIIERRLWNEAVREGFLEGLQETGHLKIRKAFGEIAGDITDLPDALLAVSEILSLAMKELEARIRVQSAIHHAVWSRILALVPGEERRRVEHEIRTLSLKDIDL